MTQHEPVRPVTVPATSPPTLPSFTLLLHVNDSTDDQVLFQAACRRAGVPFHWHIADSPEKAISYLNTLVNQSKTHTVCWPELVLLDVFFPGDTGFKVLKYIRATPELQALPVIVLTGHQSPDLKDEASRLGANCFFLKVLGFDETVNLARAVYEAWLQLRLSGGPASGGPHR